MSSKKMARDLSPKGGAAPSEQPMSIEEAIAMQPKKEEPPTYFLGTTPIPWVLPWIAAAIIRIAVLVFSVWNAFRIRTYALKKYGMIIHEFDPYFNYRATQYLSKNGWTAFFQWFDHMSWYPLGRPVGTTIYPGMQITAVAIHRALRYVGKPYAMSLNDVCCLIPCWFGSIATLSLGMLTYECSGSANAAVISTLIMGIIPAHIMRSVGGGYDNESIAMTAICLTFYFWVRSIRPGASFIWGVLAGLAYGYMVAAWGGYVFVLNMVGCHCGALVVIDWLRGQYSRTMYKNYTLFYIIGTFCATRVPVVGTTPLRSLEQIAPMLLFILMQTLEVSEWNRRKHRYAVWSARGISNRLRTLAIAGAFMCAVGAMLWPTGYFGPLSSRVRGLFVKHTRTGNPLVDSVAEHQPASPEAYWQYLHFAMYFAQIGGLIVLLTTKYWRQGNFLTLYALVAYGFSHKMVRLIILTAPVVSALAGIALGAAVDYALRQFWWNNEAEEAQITADEEEAKKERRPTPLQFIRNLERGYRKLRPARIVLACLILAMPFVRQREAKEFTRHCEDLAQSFAHPQIVFETHLNNGQRAIIDDYRQAYLWLKKNTPEDSRVMAWWDYGYQIAGIANRTTIADGNTWNHEHIATLGKCLTSPVKEAHRLIRHIADYVLIWAGGGSDDLAKSPHMARIGNSVYRDICPRDPLCAHFGFDQSRHRPTPMMARSLLYNLHEHDKTPGVHVDEKLFQEVHTSQYGLVRIFKVMNISEASKAWLADPANRKCDAPGSWYCVGQYPPAKVWQKLLAKRRDFGQLEDFNKLDKQDKEYYQEYMRRFGEE
eukprot:PhM_4_TR10228/c1_g1_i1/m.37151/K07151/STT3; dolichyl-diphosphooligosaccharide--protein glycosyltransferase